MKHMVNVIDVDPVKLKMMRLALGLSLDRVAEMAFMSDTYINYLENGKRDNKYARVYLKSFYLTFYQNLGAEQKLFVQKCGCVPNASNRYYFQLIKLEEIYGNVDFEKELIGE